MAVEPDFHTFFRLTAEPDFPARKPEIRQFSLPAVHQLLPKNAIFIPQRIAHRRVAQRCKRIHKTGRKASKAAISKACVRFCFIKRIQLQAHAVKCFTKQPLQAEVIEVVF